MSKGAREYIPPIEGVDVYEIPQILMFVCGLLLMAIIATTSWWLRALFGALFMSCVAVITVMTIGVDLLIGAMIVALVVLALFVLLSDEFANRYGIQTTVRKVDTVDRDERQE